MNAHWVDQYEWPALTANAVKRTGMFRDEAAALTDQEWLRFPYIGRNGLRWIRRDFPAPAPRKAWPPRFVGGFFIRFDEYGEIIP